MPHPTKAPRRRAGHVLATVSLAAAALAFADAAIAQTLTIESWRNDDLPIWQEKIIPAFEAKQSRHQGRVRADRRRPNTTPRSTPSSTPARPATSSPAVRSTPRSSSSTRAISPT